MSPFSYQIVFTGVIAMLVVMMGIARASSQGNTHQESENAFPIQLLGYRARVLDGKPDPLAEPSAI